ncbi:hypothetical protein QVN85_13990 [Oscillibacter valericigenes]|jgi:hypothetical protein|nr:hypothetical protein [Oscillibacter sp.]MDN0034002.1 hypothetical protein [Oscillibacter valericigenes]MEA4828094.1 hypothetical protein [Clostridium sp.]MEA4994129.1 hypothetical protein [Oscillibacter sp.]
MDKTMLTLKHGVTLIEQGGQTGLVLQGRARFAQDPRQAKILRALVKRLQSLESLMALLHTRDDPQSENENSLTIAEFILDFSEFLES